MNTDEKAIIDYLKGWPHTFISGREIARKVGGRARYEDDRGWARPILAKMVQLGFIETDHMGYYRLSPAEETKGKKAKFVAPVILRILRESGKTFESITIDEDDDAPPIPEYRRPGEPDGSGRRSGS